jgi:hypothetical protein
VDSQPALLEEAVPLLRGVSGMVIYAFAAEENPEGEDAPLIRQRWPAYEASTASELPGYVEMEITTTGGMAVSWVFELGWSITDEAVSTEDDDAQDGTPNNGANDGQGTQDTETPQPDSTGNVGDRT